MQTLLNPGAAGGRRRPTSAGRYIVSGHGLANSRHRHTRSPYCERSLVSACSYAGCGAAAVAGTMLTVFALTEFFPSAAQNKTFVVVGGVCLFAAGCLAAIALCTSQDPAEGGGNRWSLPLGRSSAATEAARSKDEAPASSAATDKRDSAPNVCETHNGAQDTVAV